MTEPRNSRTSPLLPLLPETSVHPVLPTALIVRTRSTKPEKFHRQKIPHAPDLSPANPPVPLSAAAVRLLRLSCARHQLLRLFKTNLHLKFRSQTTSHAPSRAGVFSPQSQNNYNCGFHATCPLLDLRTKSIVVAMPPRALSYIKTSHSENEI
uniref:Uncharacterized protein n=1 Tax=Fagus sylvatica TaxID=28930 RepID=A0A2N9F038_FAGSY